MFFGKKDENIASEILDQLQKNPDLVWVGPTLMAIWLSEEKNYLIVMGDYRNLTEEEVVDVLIQKRVALAASRN